jgi:membrane protease YdiL (CAAX protease family)
MLRVIIVAVLAMALPVGISLGGAIFFGYMNDPYSAVLIWAGVCTIAGIWFYRQSFSAAFNDGPYSLPVIFFNIVAIVLFMGLCILGANSAAYFLTRSILN